MTRSYKHDDQLEELRFQRLPKEEQEQVRRLRRSILTELVDEMAVRLREWLDAYEQERKA
jgi:recombinational DNA repair protein (RecF pathway)